MDRLKDQDSRIDTALFEQRYTFGGEGFLELAAAFSTYMQDEMSVLTKSIERSCAVAGRERAAELAGLAHGLAGSAATFGLRGVQEASLQMERTLLQGRAAAIRASFLVLEDECRHALAFLQRMADRARTNTLRQATTII